MQRPDAPFDKQHPSVSLCFPAYNEELTVERVLRDASRIATANGLDYELIVCDDGSTDSTAEIIKNLAQEIPNLRLIEHEANRGIQFTFEHLYSEAAKEFVFLNSTDGQWPSEILLKMLAMASDCDIVIASRIHKHYSLTRRVVSWCFNRIPRVLFGVNTYDAGAVKLVRREIIQRFSLVSKSPFAEAERLIRASRAGYRICNYPVRVQSRKTGKARGASLRTVMSASRDAWRVYRALRD
jgi:glycosyltransferase involved in cell wall biosynthesis